MFTHDNLLSYNINIANHRLKVMIYEHFSSNGLKETDDWSLACEGFFMARTLFSRFLSLDCARPVMIVNEGFSSAFGPTEQQSLYIVPDGKGEEALLELCGSRPAVVIIAPETNGLSACIASKAIAAGGTILGPSPRVIKTASNKARLPEVLKDKDIPCPPFRSAQDQTTLKSAASSWGFPLVVKPTCGTGGEKSALLEDERDLHEFLKSNMKAGLKGLIVQPFLEGMPASLSLLVSRSGKAHLISVNEQKIALDEKGDGRPAGFRYTGGRTGLSGKDYSRFAADRNDLQRLAQAVADAFPGLMGYAGIDLIMTSKGPQVLEVNPRMTTPLAVLGSRVSWNIASALLEACISDDIRQLPQVPKIDFSREDIVCKNLFTRRS